MNDSNLRIARHFSGNGHPHSSMYSYVTYLESFFSNPLELTGYD